MLNIISTFENATKIGGPQKVFANLTKGLDKIGYPYVINRNLNSTKRLWVHDDIDALRYLGRTKAKTVVGPNLFVMPKDIIDGAVLHDAIYLTPGPWATEMWQSAGFDSCPTYPWPVGIDTDEFHPPKQKASEKKVLVYHKLRQSEELELILRTLEEMRLDYNLVVYGNYDQDEYQELLKKSSFIIWHGCHESQGLALQEALASDVPILVCDVKSVSEELGVNYEWHERDMNIRVTAAPYFDSRCGKIIENLNELKDGIQYMFDNLSNFKPREFVLENLSLEGQALKLLSFWEHWDLSFDEGLNERPKRDGKWPPIQKRIWGRVKPLLSSAKQMMFRE